MNRQPAFNLSNVVSDDCSDKSTKVQREIISALASQDAIGYAKSFLRLGLSVEDNSDNLPLLLRGLDEIEMERIRLPVVKKGDPNLYDQKDNSYRYAKLLEAHSNNPPGRKYPDNTYDMVVNLSHASYPGLNAPGGFRSFVELRRRPDIIFRGYERILADARRWKAKKKAEANK